VPPWRNILMAMRRSARVMSEPTAGLQFFRECIRKPRSSGVARIFESVAGSGFGMLFLMKSSRARLLLVFILIFGALPDIAEGAQGKIAYSKGLVTVDAKPVALGQVVNEGQAVKTGEASIALVRLDDGSMLKLNANSELILDPGGVRLQSGGVFSEVQKKKTTHFYVRTKSVTMGVRGTRFFTAYGKEGKNGPDVWMCVEDGQVAVETPGNTKSVVVNPGEGIFVPSGKDVTPPKPYGWTKGLNWNMDPAKGDIVDHTSLKSQYHDLTDQNYD
jgi:hypothetical protein